MEQKTGSSATVKEMVILSKRELGNYKIISDIRSKGKSFEICNEICNSPLRLSLV